MGRLTKCPVAAEPSSCVAGSSPQFPSEESRAQIRLFNHRVRGSDHARTGSDSECDHHRRETRVGGDIIAREFGEEGTEGNARGDPHGGGQQNSGSNVA
jgi:hypothetical protein